MLKTISLLALAAIAAVLLVAAMRPGTFQVARSATVQAPADRLHPLINDLRQFNTWNPYNKKDPAMQGEYRGPQAGPGAAFHFQGNKDVGKGSIRITDEMKNGMYLIRVTDTGIGIAPEELPLIFNRFKKNAAGSEGSYGLGLSIVKSIADYHGMKISAVSAPGKGTTFLISVPGAIVAG